MVHPTSANYIPLSSDKPIWLIIHHILAKSLSNLQKLSNIVSTINKHKTINNHQHTSNLKTLWDLFVSSVKKKRTLAAAPKPASCLNSLKPEHETIDTFLLTFPRPGTTTILSHTSNTFGIIWCFTTTT
jgi:hypothetical protein